MSRYNFDKFRYNKSSSKIPENNEEEKFNDDCYSSPQLSPALDLSLQKEPKINYTLHDNYVFISSQSRDTTAYPLHYDYRIKFVNVFKNVRSIEMVSAIIPNSSGILDEPVVVFDINEINHIDFSTPTGYKKAFSILPISEPNKATDGFINLKPAQPVLTYKLPISSLSAISVKLLDITGSPLTFGPANGSTAKALQHSFLLKIVTEDRSRAPLKYRNQY